VYLVISFLLRLLLLTKNKNIPKHLNAFFGAIGEVLKVLFYMIYKI